MKVLIADDDRDICAVVKKIILRDGHSCCFAYEGTDVVPVYQRESPDLVLLDVMMPGKNGFDVCRDLRQIDHSVPIIMVSAKSDIVDKSIGFAAGADDYVSKPFDPEELLLCIDAGLRRVRVAGEDHPRARRSVASVGDLEIHFKRSIVLKRGVPINLTPKEFQIVALLANHMGEVITSKEIVANIWGEGYSPETTSIPVFVRKIRRKIEDDPSKPKYLQTIWREGYRLGSEKASE